MSILLPLIPLIINIQKSGRKLVWNSTCLMCLASAMGFPVGGLPHFQCLILANDAMNDSQNRNLGRVLWDLCKQDTLVRPSTRGDPYPVWGTYLVPGGTSNDGRPWPDYCLHLVPKFGDVRGPQNWRLHQTVEKGGLYRRAYLLTWYMYMGRPASRVQPPILAIAHMAKFGDQM